MYGICKSHAYFIFDTTQLAYGSLKYSNRKRSRTIRIISPNIKLFSKRFTFTKLPSRTERAWHAKIRETTITLSTFPIFWGNCKTPTISSHSKTTDRRFFRSTHTFQKKKKTFLHYSFSREKWRNRHIFVFRGVPFRNKSENN